ncbi:dolichyl-phosphate beta-glucosyltransferase [Bifidobacterium moraviense]|nr:dolichyl-phosphate beta-glucosyltransferase [Bifidobacterium sp. DSM 109958]
MNNETNIPQAGPAAPAAAPRRSDALPTDGGSRTVEAVAVGAGVPGPADVIAQHAGAPRRVDADIVIPVYNEQEQLAASVVTLMNHLETHRREGWAYTWNIVIADNASTDATWGIAERLSAQYPERVRAIRIPAKGRGRALKLAWGESRARVVAYMDVDLSTDIAQTDELIGALLYGGADVSIGCRLFDESQVVRSAKREVISRTYNTMLRVMLGAAFHDAQCGFKGMTSEAARYLLPLIRDDEWFFDTEMLLLAQTVNMRIWEFPVHWVEDAGTTVNIPDTVRKDLAGMWRMRRTLSRMRANAEAAVPPAPDGRGRTAVAGTSGKTGPAAAAATA